MFRQMTKEKESGLTKLIELLNEYETPQSGVVFKSYDNYDGTFYGVDCDGETEIAWSDSLIISKKFGFIKWLVENEKIEVTNIWRLPKRLYINTDGITCVDDMCEDCYYNAYESLLMLLSIQDKPIEDLISYLK